MIKFILLFATSTAINSCGPSGKKAKADKPPKHEFEKIIFHTTSCYGTCPAFHLEINSDKTIQLFAETVFKNLQSRSSPIDSSKVGYFTGLASDSILNKIDKEIKSIDIDSLNFDGADCCDGSVITIIIYYGGKRKFLESMFPPQKANALISLLYETCNSNELKRTNKKFVIEGDKKINHHY